MPELNAERLSEFIFELCSVSFEHIASKSVIELNFCFSINDGLSGGGPETFDVKFWDRLVGKVELSGEFMIFQGFDFDPESELVFFLLHLLDE